MRYENVVSAVFLERKNRFVAKVMLDGKEETVHVKNTGRCKELLLEGARIYLSVSANPERKTKYDLIAVEKKTPQGTLLVNLDSQIPNALAEEWLKKGNLFSKNAVIRREVTFENSRFDLYVEDGDRRAFIEVKGVTLENGGHVMFPDAPTLRGVKHLEELILAKEKGYEAFVFFVIQLKGAKSFSPNDATHPAFGEALRRAQRAGVEILAYDCNVASDSLSVSEQVPITL